MYCPDCGDRLVEGDRFCQYCGYPSGALDKRLKDEKEASLGWAEKIIGGKPKPEIPSESPEKIHTFVDVKDPEPEDAEDNRLKCESCLSYVDYGTLCPECGDRLPTLGANDNFFIAVLRNLFRFIIAPAHFARSFPYPIKGGTMQAIWIPAILSGLYILTLPASRAFLESRIYENLGVLGFAFIGMTLYILLIPILLFLTGALNHWVAYLLGGHSPFRRTIRITGAALTVLMLAGLIRNISTAILFLIWPELDSQLFIKIENNPPVLSDQYRILVYVIIILAGWYHAWLMSGLHRLNWWKTLVHLIATYVTLIWWIWFITYFGIPLLLIGI